MDVAFCGNFLSITALVGAAAVTRRILTETNRLGFGYATVNGVIAVDLHNLRDLVRDAAYAADDEWSDAIAEAFPGEDRGDVRYMRKAEGKPGTRLAAAYARFRETSRLMDYSLRDDVEVILAHLRDNGGVI